MWWTEPNPTAATSSTCTLIEILQTKIQTINLWTLKWGTSKIFFKWFILAAWSFPLLPSKWTPRKKKKLYNCKNTFLVLFFFKKNCATKVHCNKWGPAFPTSFSWFSTLDLLQLWWVVGKISHQNGGFSGALPWTSTLNMVLEKVVCCASKRGAISYKIYKFSEHSGYLKWRNPEPYSRLFLGWAFPYISRIHTAI